jgi:hypothetical protein
MMLQVVIAVPGTSFGHFGAQPQQNAAFLPAPRNFRHVEHGQQEFCPSARWN